VSVNLGSLFYELGIEDNTKKDLDEAARRQQQWEKTHGKVEIAVDANIKKAFDNLEKARKAVAKADGTKAVMFVDADGEHVTTELEVAKRELVKAEREFEQRKLKVKAEGGVGGGLRDAEGDELGPGVGAHGPLLGGGDLLGGHPLGVGLLGLRSGGGVHLLALGDQIEVGFVLGAGVGGGAGGALGDDLVEGGLLLGGERDLAVGGRGGRRGAVRGRGGGGSGRGVNQDVGHRGHHRPGVGHVTGHRAVPAAAAASGRSP